MLPSDESDPIVLVISEAFAAGAEGRLPRGYLLLNDGLHQARAAQTPWAPEAFLIWRTALERFKTRFPAEWYPAPRA
jgi:hypothetical protein